LRARDVVLCLDHENEIIIAHCSKEFKYKPRPALPCYGCPLKTKIERDTEERANSLALFAGAFRSAVILHY